MKFKITLFFLILFAGVIIIPTVISLANDDQGISISLSLSEDEEKSLETKSLCNTIISANSYSNIFFRKIQKVKNIRFTSKKYTIFLPKTVTPPPEFLS